MSRQSISFTSPNAAWLDKKVNVEHEYKSKSEAVNDLIRKARETELMLTRRCSCGLAHSIEESAEDTDAASPDQDL